jgi:hypothetical protein
MSGPVRGGASPPARRIPWLTLFAVAFGLLEAAVVVYLRELYYPDGFRFPIVVIPPRVAAVELVRELTTLLMLWAVAALGGRDRLDRFFVFAYLFGVWDVVYYIGLRLFVGWPDSLLTWDVLFLIPVPWLGPVLYPVLVSLCLIGGFVAHDALRRSGRAMRLGAAEQIVAVAGAITVVVAFCWNWRAVSEGTVPEEFPVAMFVAGLVAGVAPYVRAVLRAMRG